MLNAQGRGLFWPTDSVQHSVHAYWLSAKAFSCYHQKHVQGADHKVGKCVCVAPSVLWAGCGNPWVRHPSIHDAVSRICIPLVPFESWLLFSQPLTAPSHAAHDSVFCIVCQRNGPLAAFHTAGKAGRSLTLILREKDRRLRRALSALSSATLGRVDVGKVKLFHFFQFAQSWIFFAPTLCC